MNKTDNLSTENLQTLIQTVQQLLLAPDLDTLIPKLLDMALDVTEAERGYILLRDTDGNMSPSVQRGIEPGTIPEGDPSNAVIEEAFKERLPVLSRNAALDPRFTGSESIILRGIRAACCIPMETRGSQIGAIYLDTTGVGKLTDDILPLLEAFGSIAALAVARTMELDNTRSALKSATTTTPFKGIVGNSPIMIQLFARMDRLAAADLPVLITGGSGTGKELISRALHDASPRSKHPFRAIFCGNLTADLLESELFGYKKGAFTGAFADKPGLLDLTDGGTLFLDEIADVPALMQAKLLRFLQDGEYQRLGDPAQRRANVRILSATNKNLMEEIKANNFREDLFYRLNVLTIESPDLCDRADDIPLLAASILTKVSTRTGQPLRNISAAALDKLGNYNWPGNVRELENVLSRAAVLAMSDVIDPEDIDLPNFDSIVNVNDAEELDLQTVVENHLKKVLAITNGNRSEAARILGVSRRYLQKNLAKWREEDAN
jgi:Nif-specific regulatory protein